LKPRAILIHGCGECVYSQDFSSGGYVCTKEATNKTIVNGLSSREEAKKTIPSWCPLPEVLKVKYK